MQICKKRQNTEIAFFWEGEITEDVRLFIDIGLAKVMDHYSNGIYEKYLYVKVGEYSSKDVYIDEEVKNKLGIKDCGYAKGVYKWQNVQLFNWVVFKDIIIFNGAIEDTEKAKAKIISYQSYIENYGTQKIDLNKPIDLFSKLEESELN